MTVVFLRYEQLKTIWGTNNPKKNKVSLALGLLAGIGLSIVANFQVTIQKSMITCHANSIKRGINLNSSKSVVLFKEHLQMRPTAAVAQWVRAFAPQAEGWVFESQVQ